MQQYEWLVCWALRIRLFRWFTWRRKERGKAQWGHCSSLGRGNLERLSQAGFPASSQVEYVSQVKHYWHYIQCSAQISACNWWHPTYTQGLIRLLKIVLSCSIYCGQKSSQARWWSKLRFLRKSQPERLCYLSKPPIFEGKCLLWVSQESKSRSINPRSTPVTSPSSILSGSPTNQSFEKSLRTYYIATVQ